MKKKITSFFMALLLIMLCTEPVRAESVVVHENQTEIETSASEGVRLDMAVDRDSLSSRFKIYELDDFSEGQSRIPFAEIEEAVPAMGRNSVASNTETFIEGDFKYAILADGSAKVVDYLGNETDVVVPSMADQHLVKTIGTYAFAHDNMIETLTFSEGIIAFEQASISSCSSLRELNLPASLGMDSEDGESPVITGLSCVPMYCNKMEIITVSEESEILTAQDGVLYNKSMTELLYYPTGKKDETYAIPNGVKTIGSDSFHGNSYLKKVTMPDTVTYIGYWAFCGVSSLEEINISNNCTTIGQYALSGTAIESLELPASLDVFLVWYMYMDSLKSITVDENNSVYSSHDGVLYDKNKSELIYCPSAKEGDYAILDSVTYIEEDAFKNCCLSSVTIPWSAAIGINNFLGNKNPLIIYGYDGSVAEIYAQDCEIEFVSIGETPEFEVAFGSCGEHLAWKLDSRGVLTISGTGMMSSAPWQENYRNRITSIVIEEGVESIGGWGQYHGLSNITLPSTLKVIGDGAFTLCPRLSDFVIPDGVVEIGRSAFSECDNLTHISIPASVEKIGDSAFRWCKRLEEITVDFDNWNYSSIDGVLFNLSQTELIQYPAGKNSHGTYVIPAGVQHIGYGAFAYSRINFNTVVIPDSVVDIKDNAFGDSYVQNVFIGEGTINIESSAFYSCQSLRQIFIGSNVACIEGGAFRGLYSLETIYYPASKEDWNRIDIGDANDDIYRAAIIYGKEIVSLNEEHTFGSIGSKAPSCLEDGNIYYFKCTDCGKCYSDPTGIYELTEEQIVAMAKGHKIKRVEAKEALCIEDGNIQHYKCIFCGKLYQDEAGKEEMTEEETVIAAKGHEMEKVEEKGAICTESGNIQHYKCTFCGKLYRDEAGKEEMTEEETVIAAKGHEMEKVEEKGAICTESGNIQHYKCTFCGKLYRDEAGKEEMTEEETVIAAKGHEMEKVEEKGATCTESGNVQHYKCIFCGKLYQDEAGKEEMTEEETVIAAKGHEMEKVEEKGAICTESGNIQHYKCAFCGKLYRDEAGKEEMTEEEAVIPAKGHEMEKVEEKGAACTESGKIQHYKCILCGKLYREEAGKEEMTEEEAVIAAKGHEMEKMEEKGATCTESGNIQHYKCAFCGKLYRDEAGKEEMTEEEAVILAKNHTFGKWEIMIQPDYGKQGVEQRVCSLCGKTETRMTDELEGKLEIGSIILSKTSYTYNGKVQKPVITVKDSAGKILNKKTDYTISVPKGMKNVGRYTVTVTLKGNYTGTIDKTFDIVPKGTSISKVAAKKKGFIVKWKKQPSQTTGYEIAYSTSSKFSKKNTKTLAVKKNKTISKTISKLKAKKKYYVRIRTYKTVKVNEKSTKLYSTWSKVKTVKTKK